MLIIKARSPNAHNRIQDVRRANPDGFLVNYRGPQSAMLHRAGYCPHFGDTEWEENINNWGSLGNSTKVFSEQRTDLEKWARSEGIHLRVCSDCHT